MRLLRRERGRTGATRHLLVPARPQHSRNGVVGTHAVERRKSVGIRWNVVIDGARGASEWIVPHVHLEGPHWREQTHSGPGRPLEPVEPQGRRLVFPGTDGTS